jgi:F-type H+-transporting ATPase subunit delta
VTDSVTYSRPYAEAAYKIAVESNATSLWADNLMILSEVIKDAEVKAIIASPRVDDKKSLSFLNSFLRKDDTSFSNFLSIMINNKKIYFLDEVYKLFNDMLLNDQEITVAEVETAFALTELQKENLSKTLMKQHAQKVQIKEIINQDLLAGIKISVNNEVTDYSIRNKLNLMKEQIINNR